VRVSLDRHPGEIVERASSAQRIAPAPEGEARQPPAPPDSSADRSDPLECSREHKELSAPCRTRLYAQMSTELVRCQSDCDLGDLFPQARV
jgi:hypothetical protein